MNAAKSTSCASSTRRSSVVVPGLKEVVQGSTRATSSRPRVSAWSSFACLPDEPRKMRGLSIRSSLSRSLARSELFRGRAHESSKCTGEMAGVLEACRQARLEDRALRVPKGLLGALDPLPQNILMGRAADAFSEELRKVVGAHPGDPRKLCDAQVPRQVLADVIEDPPQATRRHSSFMASG